MLVGEVSAQMTQALRDTVLKEHNRLRRDAIGAGGPDEVSTVTATAMLEMEYDMKLECVAQAYIETQSDGFTHNSNRSVDYAACGGAGYVGENWYSGAPFCLQMIESLPDHHWILIAGDELARWRLLSRLEVILGHWIRIDPVECAS
jgi:hypothetical protein